MPQSAYPIRTITLTIARRLAIMRQHLAGPRPTPDGAHMLAIVRDLRCLQLDPISAVARSHLLVLFSRLGVYDPAQLDILLWQERVLFEYWAHCASLVLTEDYPIFRRRMNEYTSGTSAWAQQAQAWLAEHAALRAHILDELRTLGPLSSQHFEDEATTSLWFSGWTSGRAVNRMIDCLWAQGEIMVAQRIGQQRRWDLAERCLPDWTPRAEMGEHESTARAAQYALRALGVARPQHIKQHFTRGRYPDLAAILAELEESGVIVRVDIHDEQAGMLAGPWYVHQEDLPLLDSLIAGVWEPRTVVLSPFDNLICDRKRTELLFGFTFRMEIYVPKDQRQYGYYVMPILQGDRLIGRIDPRYERVSRQLQINALHFEPQVKLLAKERRALALTIEELAQFVGAKDIAYGPGVAEALAGRKASLRPVPVT